MPSFIRTLRSGRGCGVTSPLDTSAGSPASSAVVVSGTSAGSIPSRSTGKGRMRQALVFTCAWVALPLLSACGGTTVDSSNALASQTSTVQEKTTDRAVNSAETKRRAVDDPAHEISSLPERKPQLSAVDEQMLENLKEEGIDVSGYEVQLAGLGSRVCQDKTASDGVDAIVTAVAGQLVEQGKSEKSTADTALILSDVARQAYC